MSFERSRAARRQSLINASYYRAVGRQPPVIWNLQGVRGQMSADCLWHACRAFFIGLLLFGIGTAMCVVGFYSDGVFDPNNNGTTGHISREMYFRDPRRQLKFSKLSYVGPIIMGVGGFVIVATCVMTFEARDSAAKVGPAAYGLSTRGEGGRSSIYPLVSSSTSKSRREVRSIGTQTPSTILTYSSNLQLFDRRHIMEAFRKFSKTLRSSTSVSSWNGEQLHRSPSAPSLLSTNLTNAPTTRTAPPSHISNTKKFLLRSNKPRLSPALRQAMSVDYSNSHSQNSSIPPMLLSEQRQTISTQTLTLPSSQRANQRVYRSRPTQSISSECYTYQSNATICGGEIETLITFENECENPQTTNVSVHREPNEKTKTIHVLLPTTAQGSSTSLRTLSPHPSFVSEDSFDRSSAKSEIVTSTNNKSPLISPVVYSKCQMLSGFGTKYHSTDSSFLQVGRPYLMRQAKIDYSTGGVVIESKSEDDDGVLEEDLSTIPE